MTHWQGAPGQDQGRFGVNMRMFDPADVADAQVEISFGPE
jgi:hypothetical protein